MSLAFYNLKDGRTLIINTHDASCVLRERRKHKTTETEDNNPDAQQMFLPNDIGKHMEDWSAQTDSSLEEALKPHQSGPLPLSDKLSAERLGCRIRVSLSSWTQIYKRKHDLITFHKNRLERWNYWVRTKYTEGLQQLCKNIIEGTRIEFFFLGHTGEQHMFVEEWTEYKISPEWDRSPNTPRPVTQLCHSNW